MGSTAHAALLEGSLGVEVIDPEQYPSKTGSIPEGWTNNAIRAARDAARQAGKTPILKRHYVDVRNMVDAAQAFIKDSVIADRWHDAQSEVTAIWTDGATPFDTPEDKASGVWMRARIDRLTNDRTCAFDYKSTTDVSPDGFGRQLVRMGYHIQDAIYRRCVYSLTGKMPRFIILAQSVEEPYECTLHECDETLREIADAEVERAIGLWRQCLATSTWPSYGGRINRVSPPNYMLAEHESRILETEQLGWRAKAA